MFVTFDSYTLFPDFKLICEVVNSTEYRQRKVEQHIGLELTNKAERSKYEGDKSPTLTITSSYIETKDSIF